MTIEITHVFGQAVPIGPQGHQIHLDASPGDPRTMRATCVCGVVATGLRDAHEVLTFIQTHRDGHR